MFRTICPGMRSEFGKLPRLWAPWIQMLADHENDSRCLELEDKWFFSQGPEPHRANTSSHVWFSESLRTRTSFLKKCLHQKWADSFLWSKFGPRPTFVNKVLLEHSPAHSYPYCVWLLSHRSSGVGVL